MNIQTFEKARLVLEDAQRAEEQKCELKCANTSNDAEQTIRLKRKYNQHILSFIQLDIHKPRT